MFASGVPSGLVDGDIVSLETASWDGGVDALSGRGSFSLNFDLGVIDESPSASSVTLTFFLESPGPSVGFGPSIGELAAGKAGLSGFDDAASRAYLAERGFVGQAPRGMLEESVLSSRAAAQAKARNLARLPEEHLKNFEGRVATQTVFTERTLLVRYGRPGEYFTNFISRDAEYVADRVAWKIERIRLGGALYEAPEGTVAWVGRVAPNQFGRGGAVQYWILDAEAQGVVRTELTWEMIFYGWR